MDMPAHDEPAVSRRRALGAGLGALALGGVGFGVGRETGRGATEHPAAMSTDGRSAVIPATGRHQAGVAYPVVAPSALRLEVSDLRSGTALGAVLSGLGELIEELASGSHSQVRGLSPARLSVTVALGPRVIATADPNLPGTAELPDFAGDTDIPARQRGGDLAIQFSADDPVLVAMAASIVGAYLAPSTRPRWSQNGFRGPAIGSAARNVLGFVDGITVPHGAEELRQQVWLDEPAAVAGASLMVVRRFRIDVPAFTRLTVARQEAVIGRRRASSAPLSGGTEFTDPDLGAKAANGDYLIPALSHVRRANPTTVGAGLMLRRSYSILGDDTSARPGLLFISYQRDLRTFIATQQRLDEGDAMLDYAKVDASGTFLVLPGFGPQNLGKTMIFPT